MAVQTVYKEDQQKRQTQAKLHQILDKHNIDSDASMSDVEEEELGIRDGDSLENSDDDEDNLSISDLTDSGLCLHSDCYQLAMLSSLACVFERCHV